MAPKPTPRRSLRLTVSPQPPSPPRRRPSKAPSKLLAVPKNVLMVPSARASRALKRRRQSDELHNEYEPRSRSIKRRKLCGDPVCIASPSIEDRPQPRVQPRRSLPDFSSAPLSPLDIVKHDPMLVDEPQPTPPRAAQPLSYSRFPPRARSPLSSSLTVPPAHRTSISLSPSFSVSQLSYLSSPRSRKRRNLFVENRGRIGDAWKYCCIERVETLFAKYGYSTVLAAERQAVGATLDRANFRISTPLSYGDVDMYDDDDEEEEDLDDIDEEILKSIEDELNDGMLDIDAEGEIDPDHIPSLEPSPGIHESYAAFFPASSSLPPRYSPLPTPFPRLDSVIVPGLGHALSDDVQIGPVEAKLSRGRRRRQIVHVRGKEIVEWRLEDRGGYMGRGTPIDDCKRRDWLMTGPHPGFAWNASWIDPNLNKAKVVPPTDDSQVVVAAGQDWTSFLDNLARIMNMRSTPDRSFSFSATLADGNVENFNLDASSMALPASLTSLLDCTDFQHLDHLLSGGLDSALTSSPTVAYASSSSTLSRALG